jgi:hypothetical protein
MIFSKNHTGNNLQYSFDSKKVAHYDELARKAVFGYDQLFTMVLSLLVEKQNESANVLIVGCGTGMELTINYLKTVIGDWISCCMNVMEIINISIILKMQTQH